MKTTTDHTAAAANPAPEHPYQPRLADWRAFAAAAGATLAAVSTADASIIYGTLNVDVTVPTAAPAHASTGRQAFTIGGVAESAMIQRAPGGSGRPGAFSDFVKLAGTAKLFCTDYSGGVAANFGKGQAIGGSYQSNGAILGGNRGDGGFGNFDNGKIGYVGLQLPNGDLGWLEVEVGDRNSDGYPDELKVLGYAYNDVSGAPISADQGAPAAAPEPPRPRSRCSPSVRRACWRGANGARRRGRATPPR